MEDYKNTLKYLDSIDLCPILMELYQRHMTDMWDVYDRISNLVEEEIDNFSMTFDELIDYLREHYELYIREEFRYELVPSLSSKGIYFRKKD